MTLTLHSNSGTVINTNELSVYGDEYIYVYVSSEVNIIRDLANWYTSGNGIVPTTPSPTTAAPTTATPTTAAPTTAAPTTAAPTTATPTTAAPTTAAPTTAAPTTATPTTAAPTTAAPTTAAPTTAAPTTAAPTTAPISKKPTKKPTHAPITKIPKECVSTASGEVCGVTPKKACRSRVTHSQAINRCRSYYNSRLCTQLELNKTVGTGCDLDFAFVWTSTSCESNSYLQIQHRNPSGIKCTESNDKGFVRCCFDRP